MSNIIDSIQLSGNSYDMRDKSATKVVEITQSDYDNLPSSAKTDTSKMYVITDAQAGDLSQYWTSAQTQSAITQATSGKVETSAITSAVTSASTDSEIPTAKAVWDVASQGGGGGGGVNVVQTTGTSTTDVMSQDAVTTQLNDKANKTTAARGLGYGSKNTYGVVHLINQNDRQITGYYYTLSLSKINGKHIVAQGDGNPNTFSLVETSAITTSVTSSSTDSEIPSAKCVYDQLGGLKLVKLTQSAYDALSPNYDSNTLYVIVN